MSALDESSGDVVVSRPQPVVLPGMPRFTRVCAGLAGALGLAGLVGWIFGVDVLLRIAPSFANMKGTTAVGVILLSVAWFVPRYIGIWMACAVLAMASFIVVGISLGVRFDLRHLQFVRFGDRAMNATLPSMASGVSLLVLSAAALLAYTGRLVAAQIVGIFALVTATIALLGYAYDVDSLYSTRPFTTVALHSALAGALLAVALLASIDGGGLTWALKGPDPGAHLVRRLLPITFVGLPVLGLGVLLLLRHGLVDGEGTGLALFVTICALSGGALIWVAARRVGRVDEHREQTLRELSEFKDGLQALVEERAGQLEQHGGQIAVLEDRQRIAADLHDIVIQRLFAAGMFLQGANAATTDRATQDRINIAVEAMDVAIRDLRHSIFELGGQRVMPVDLTTALDDVCRESARVLGFTPDLTVDDPDREADSVREDLLAVLRESLANVARHAEASSVVVVLRSAGGVITLTVTDDGRGMGDVAHSSGTRNLADRATRRDGSCTWGSVSPHGTVLRWQVPFAG